MTYFYNQISEEYRVVTTNKKKTMSFRKNNIGNLIPSVSMHEYEGSGIPDGYKETTKPVFLNWLRNLCPDFIELFQFHAIPVINGRRIRATFKSECYETGNIIRSGEIMLYDAANKRCYCNSSLTYKTQFRAESSSTENV